MVEINFLKELGSSLLCFSVLGVVVYCLAKILKVKNDGFKFFNPKKSAIYAVIAVIISSALITILLMSVSKSQNASEAASKIQNYNLNSVINITLVYLIILLPILITKKIRKETWKSTCVSKHNLKSSIIIGTFLSIIVILSTVILGSKSLKDIGQSLTLSSLWALAYYAVVGFSEEYIFRGYLQTRLMGWIGKWHGWILASFLMALIHVPQRMAAMRLPLNEAIMSSVLLFPISLIMGYILIKTENIVAPGIYHTFANWANILM